MRQRLPIIAVMLPLVLGGCIAKTAVDIATAPVRAVGQAADWATTSQDEADRNRGREIRHREERFGALDRRYRELAEDCEDGSDRACRESVAVRREMDELAATLPREPQGD